MMNISFRTKKLVTKIGRAKKCTKRNESSSFLLFDGLRTCVRTYKELDVEHFRRMFCLRIVTEYLYVKY